MTAGYWRNANGSLGPSPMLHKVRCTRHKVKALRGDVLVRADMRCRNKFRL
jgi:hypothetical protein